MSSGLQVIGAGLGRTGTESLKHALEHLGFGACYHMFELMQHPEHLPEWEKLGRGETPEYDLLFDGYASCVDFPAAIYYREFMVRYPDAKVVLTIRDPDRWYTSASKTILRTIPRPVLRLIGLAGFFSSTARGFAKVSAYAMTTVHDQFFEAKQRDRAHTTAIFERWNAEVQETVPPDRLLVFEVAQGWEPLCAFLGVAVPDIDFPRTNDGDNFDKNLAKRLLRRE